MIRTRFTGATLVLLVSLTGCAPSDPSVALNYTKTTGGEPVENELTWQEAKAQTQSMELEIGKLIPEKIALGHSQ
ncbi:hypothetical protein KRR55_04885 [Paeniglutamicibacter sp. ABSL32-1]|uniref:hypothetical protein n=1 Tax=Paeniglutamicibacter quisquiliarum TaxID=2849498 RepID=UPI001C2DB68A|nr:hypothetical protein [Paeniglutamicibacter quisquiliarum]MBV1778451.1 hypothetical protein [Paeniglutamicibacter quisquiliarum]